MSDVGEFWTGAIVVGLIIAGVFYWNKPEVKEPTQPPEIGKYQIFSSDRQTYLVDTTSGDTWRWVFIMSDRTPSKILGQMWEKEDRFQDSEAESKFIQIVKDSDKPHSSSAGGE